jgi:hypothetical protein
MVMDVAARQKEIYEQAVAGKFNGDFYFGWEKPPKTIEELQENVKAATFIAGPGSFMSEYSLPTPSYWTYRVGSLAGQLGQLQFHGPEDKRLANIEILAGRLAQAEEDRLKSFGERPVVAGVAMRRFMNRKIEIYPEDQVVIAGGRISIYELAKALNANGQCLPAQIMGDDDVHFARRLGISLSDAIAMNLPHSLEAQCGNWRDWILGMTVMMADGSIVKSGSQAVKNVAGYDAHKLFVGTRGTLGFVVEVILKTFPKEALPHHEVEVRHEKYRYNGARPPREIWIQRTRRSDFAMALSKAGDRVLEADHASCTMWAHVPYEDELERFPDDWVIRKSCLDKNLRVTDSTQINLMKRTKEIFDPTNKFNPGEFGL